MKFKDEILRRMWQYKDGQISITGYEKNADLLLIITWHSISTLRLGNIIDSGVFEEVDESWTQVPAPMKIISSGKN